METVESTTLAALRNFFLARSGEELTAAYITLAKDNLRRCWLQTARDPVCSVH